MPAVDLWQSAFIESPVNWGGGGRVAGTPADWGAYKRYRRLLHLISNLVENSLAVKREN